MTASIKSGSTSPSGNDTSFRSGIVLGYALGGINLYYLLQIVRRDIAGMQLAYEFPAAVALGVAPIILGAAFLASLWPAGSAVRGSLVEALEYE